MHRKRVRTAQNDAQLVAQIDGAVCASCDAVHRVSGLVATATERDAGTRPVDGFGKAAEGAGKQDHVIAVTTVIINAADKFQEASRWRGQAQFL
jgi:hypothetical protein